MELAHVIEDAPKDAIGVLTKINGMGCVFIRKLCNVDSKNYHVFPVGMYGSPVPIYKKRLFHLNFFDA